MVFLFWEKTGIVASKATNTSKIRFIRSVQVLVSSLQIYFLCTNKANRTCPIPDKKDGLVFPFYPNLAMDIDWKKTTLSSFHCLKTTLLILLCMENNIIEKHL